MDYKAKLEEIEQSIETAKIKKAKLEERLSKAKEELNETWDKLKEFDIKDEDSLDFAIEDLETKLTEGIDKCQEILNN